MPATTVISHAFVLPDRYFHEWYAVLRPYLAKFERVAVVRSPAGNNLNRFRNVTAVEAPLTWWKDSALTHIRRVYPSVVMVDVIDVDTPEALAPILRRRVERDDRYGERDSEPKHIYHRFVLEWPTSARPIAVLARFNSDEEKGDLRRSLDILAHEDADILCAAPGTVTAVGGSIKVESIVEEERWITTYEGVKNRHVALGDAVSLGQVMAKAAGERLSIIVQQPPTGGISLLGLDNVMNPRDYIYIPQFRARPLVDNLRVRRLPSAYASIIGNVFSWHLLEPLEHHGRAIEKIGHQGSWLKARAITGVEGYTAAWFLKATTLTEGQEAIPGVNPVGVNLDAFHPLGTPAAARLGELGWVRFGYNVSQWRGSEDIQDAFQRYLPHVEAYREAGYRVVFTTSHQTYGEGQSAFWPWSQMTDAKWRLLSARFADMMERIAAQWAERDLVSVWQIWNEPDSLTGVASVPLSARNYGHMFDRVYRAIKSADSSVRVVTAGFNSGPQRGSAYARAMLATLPEDVKPDGLAFHPYGRGVSGHPHYSMFGHIDESVWAYSSVLPDRPLWITEWGVLDRPQDDPRHIARYADDMIRYLKRQYPGRIASLIWYAWAQGMHNGYGLVDGAGNPRPPLTKRFLSP
ncbi:MAG: cellulase family glycosylhydrolase [Chloroflexi bacterium]|nr:cellulase family glycosylhydrolase [Chloroflexota bacterium]